VPEQQVGFGLVAAAITFQPFNHIVVEPDGDWALGWPIEAANLRAGPIDHFRHVGEVNRSVGLGGDGGDFLLARGFELLHRTSVPGQMRLVRKSGEGSRPHPGSEL